MTSQITRCFICLNLPCSSLQSSSILVLISLCSTSTGGVDASDEAKRRKLTLRIKMFFHVFKTGCLSISRIVFHDEEETNFLCEKAHENKAGQKSDSITKPTRDVENENIPF